MKIESRGPQSAARPHEHINLATLGLSLRF
jgi:hypothetical protein